MIKTIVILIVGTLIPFGIAINVAAGEEYNGAITDSYRRFAKTMKMPDKLYHGKVRFDSKGKVVSMISREAIVTKDTKVVMGKMNEKTKKWEEGEPIKGGLNADIFKDLGKVVYMRVTLADDGKTITRILVTETAGTVVRADAEFDAIYKRHGPQTNGRGAISYVRIELDDKGNIINTFALTTAVVTKDTKYVMGKYNEKEKKWEAGEAIPNGVYNAIFKDLGTKTYYVRLTMRDDRRGVAQFLVRQIGEKK